MGRSAQRKGKNGEVELVNLLRGRGYSVQRGGSLTFGEVADVTGLDGVHIEVKRCETLRLPEWLRQAARDAERFKDGAPAVFFRRSREPWYVVMQLDDWLMLYDKTNNNF